MRRAGRQAGRGPDEPLQRIGPTAATRSSDLVPSANRNVRNPNVSAVSFTYTSACREYP